MSFKIWWENGHPAGYVDDLGIIADVNQWVDERIPGWYADVDLCFGKNAQEIRSWLDANLSGNWYVTGKCIRIVEDNDATLFKLTWCG